MSVDALSIPRGRLVRSRVVEGVDVVLADALSRALTGYAVLVPQETLLLDEDDRAVLTFEDGVPVLAYHVGTDAGGPRALADLAPCGPCRLDLYELAPRHLREAHDTPEVRVPPGMPAERLAGDPSLVDRTRERAPADRLDEGGDGLDALEAFLEDEARIDAIREEARAEAERRAAEWGLAGHLDSGTGGGDPSG
ncbi:hypothetical protein ACFQPA_12525 [Halomarina halobia]|uniref:DUF8054 domain-containing protein n=1 Tax=Halomarina halobia TaxID=3033386 RepID=A0ABD6A9T4_9EURY|nr:hypothetical protein [Halomarina sp. PSR21]